MTLTKGTKYDVASLTCTGWTDGDGSGHEGYNVSDYFAADGAYRGADEHGIEPTFSLRDGAMTNKSFRCSDGFVTKTIAANSAQEAAETYALVTSTVSVVEVDGDDNEIGRTQEINVTVAE